MTIEQTPALPDVEPTTLEDVKAHMRIEDDQDDTDVQAAVDATCLEVRGLPIATRAAGLADWPATVRLGATMLAASMVPRRKNQKGAPVFPADNPTIDLLLERGTFSRPSVG